MRTALIILSIFTAYEFAKAENAALSKEKQIGNIAEWREEKDRFTKPEENFKKALQALRENFFDKTVTDEEFYRAATEGMFAALNTTDDNWNRVYSPRDMADLNFEMSGKISGIGVTMDFDKTTGNGKIRNVLSGSPAQKAGLQKYDQILSVEGKRFKDLRPMVDAIRGESGSNVRIKILREDRLLDVKVTRGTITLPLVETAHLGNSTGYLSIYSFTNKSPEEVREQMKVFAGKKPAKLIIDLRDNQGGVFEKALDVADFFLNSGDVIVKTRSRDGSMKDFKAKGTAWSPETAIVILTSPETASSAEVLTAALKENRKAVVVGEKTRGKWTVEMLETLPNKFAIKYSVKQMLSPSGKSYQSEGVAPDFNISTSATVDSPELPSVQNSKARLEKDAVLRAAYELK